MPSSDSLGTILVLGREILTLVISLLEFGLSHIFTGSPSVCLCLSQCPMFRKQFINVLDDYDNDRRPGKHDLEQPLLSMRLSEQQ